MTDHDHTSRATMERFFRSELPRHDTREVVRHLLAGCSRCVATARAVAAQQGFSWLSGEPGGSAAHAGDFARYDQAFCNVLERTTALEAKVARERRDSASLLAALAVHPQERRLMMVKSDGRLHRWGLFERLLEQARAAVFQDPATAVDAAELALAVAERLDPADYSPEQRADFRTAALAALGNARRLVSDFHGAREAFAAAWTAIAEGTGDPLERASLISLEASLSIDLGHFEKAARSLGRAIRLYRKLNDVHLWGRTVLKQADALGYVDPEQGLRLVREALTLLDTQREPRLELCARHNLIWFLNDLGRPWEAQKALEASRPLYRRWGDRWTRLRLDWLEGRIARSLGNLDQAEQTFRRLWQEFKERELNHELTLLSIDLAEVYTARGKLADAARLVQDVYPLLEAWGMHADGLAAWLLLKQSLAERRAETTMFREMERYIRRAWYRPVERPVAVR